MQSSPMRSLAVGVVTVVLLTLAITVYCGVRTQRFVSFADLEESRQLLRDLPMTIGDWQAEKEGSLDSSDVHQLEIENGYVTRRYRNTKTQSEVNFVLMLGPPGRLTVHTPEICFGGRNYERERDRTLVSLPSTNLSDEDATEETFWRVSFINRALQGERIAFYYSISSGSHWAAVENPRSEFGRRFLFVYKIQVEAIVDRSGGDPAHAFLVDALPTILQHMRPCR